MFDRIVVAGSCSRGACPFVAYVVAIRTGSTKYPCFGHLGQWLEEAVSSVELEVELRTMNRRLTKGTVAMESLDENPTKLLTSQHSVVVESSFGSELDCRPRVKARKVAFVECWLSDPKMELIVESFHRV